ncbi:hypothetical protein CRYUN_Cryun33cG0041800 [Craigia yunnanensis]
MQKDVINYGKLADVSEESTNTNTIDSSNDGLIAEGSRQLDNINGSRIQLSNSTFGLVDVTFKTYTEIHGKWKKWYLTGSMIFLEFLFFVNNGLGAEIEACDFLLICLVGQLQLLSSTVTTLAVPSPSLTATLARGGNNPAVAVPLVALGTKVSEKTGGYINRLVATCLRSGLNRTFRALQKPERAPIRALRASSSGRYLLILFRDAPVEVWAMTKNPIMLRSLALPFTVLEWTLPTVPRPVQNGPSRQTSLSPKGNTAVVPEEAASSTKASSSDSRSSDGSQDDTSESFAFALVNGALGVFEVLKDVVLESKHVDKPKWPSSSFVSSDGLITAMAYRLPHVVMGDRSGNIRWWDVTTDHSSSFNTHREGIRRIKFSPVVAGDHSRGRIAVLFYDNTFSVFDLDSPEPLASSLLQPQFPGTLVLELDWLPLQTDNNDPLVLCIAGADSSFRIFEVNINDKKMPPGPQLRNIKERFWPMPLCCPVLFPTPHALMMVCYIM